MNASQITERLECRRLAQQRRRSNAKIHQNHQSPAQRDREEEHSTYFDGQQNALTNGHQLENLQPRCIYYQQRTSVDENLHIHHGAVHRVNSSISIGTI